MGIIQSKIRTHAHTQTLELHRDNLVILKLVAMQSVPKLAFQMKCYNTRAYTHALIILSLTFWMVIHRNRHPTVLIAVYCCCC